MIKSSSPLSQSPLDLAKVLVVIPAYNEERTVADVVRRLRGQGLENIRVVDNASSDGTAEAAVRAGAEVINEPRRGYGSACRTGYKSLPSSIEWILFCDADGSDDLENLSALFKCAPDADFILGNRRSGTEGRRAMTPAQNHGNGLAVFLIRLGWGFRYADLGPLRLIRRESLEAINMRDRDYGWTVEMQIRAVERGLRIREIPVGYFPRRGGRSKISGTLSGTLKAGTKILWTVFRLYLHSKRG